MKIFNRKENQIQSRSDDKLAGWIAACILRMQKCFADRMDRIFSKLSPASKKVMLAAVCAFMAGYCTILIVFSFKNVDNTFSAPAAIKCVLIPTSTLPGKENTTMPLSITRFHKYIDSLALSPKGIEKRDSLFRHRPGLMDSIKTVENLYRQ